MGLSNARRITTSPVKATSSTSSRLNRYLDLPHAGQAFVIARDTSHKKTGQRTHDITCGITRRTAEQVDARRVLQSNRRHWSIENSGHYLPDWNYDEDRSHMRTGYGPENVTRWRRFAFSLVKSQGVANVAPKLRELNMNIRLVFDYLKMTNNAGTAGIVSGG